MPKPRHRLLLLGILLSISQIQPAINQCQDNKCNFSSAFIFVDNGGVISFDDAEAACQAMGTTLATMTTVEEVAAGRESCVNGSGSSVGHCWIGLIYDRTDGRYTWVDGTTPSEDVLTEGFGNGGKGGVHSFFKGCVEISGDVNRDQQNRWNDIWCSGDGRSYDIEMYLCNNPDYGVGGAGCLCDCGSCEIQGDAHYLTFDNLLYHFMGNCSYYYVTTCDKDRSLKTGIPFEIIGEHYKCYQQTCMWAIDIRFYSSDDIPIHTATLKLGQFYSGMILLSFCRLILICFS